MYLPNGTYVQMVELADGSMTTDDFDFDADIDFDVMPGFLPDGVVCDWCGGTFDVQQTSRGEAMCAGCYYDYTNDGGDYYPDDDDPYFGEY